jgi:hypothetical protein
MPDAQEPLAYGSEINVAVFACGDDLALVRLEGDVNEGCGVPSEDAGVLLSTGR